jgi:hypothetical protein
MQTSALWPDLTIVKIRQDIVTATSDFGSCLPGSVSGVIRQTATAATEPAKPARAAARLARRYDRLDDYDGEPSGPKR